MTVILSIIVLVAIISLYDYFGSKSWQQTTSTVRNNAVFEHRNKEYGAYVIRRDYDKTLLIIMVAFIFSTGALFAAFVGFNKSEATKAKFTPPVVYEDTISIQIPKLDVPEPPVQKDEQEESSPETKAYTEPVVTDVVEPTKPLTEEELAKLKVGNEDSKKIGDGPETHSPPALPPKKEIVINEPTEFPEIEAEYPGGFPAMMKFIQNNMEFPEYQISGKVSLRFVVGEDGTVSSVKLISGIKGCDDCGKAAVKVVKKMPKWKPGKINDKPVPTYFDLPIVFEDEVH